MASIALSFGVFTFTLVAEEDALLSSYTGSILRGSLGHSLRRLCCDQQQDCAYCSLISDCLYVKLFETPQAREAGSRHSSHEPHPFVIEPPLAPKRTYRRGEPLGFKLVLIGDGTDHLSYFVAAFEHAARAGLGTERARFRLDSVVDALSQKPRVVWDARHPSPATGFAIKTLDDATSEAQLLDPGHINLLFMTPTRIKHRGDTHFGERGFVADLRFDVFARSLLRRLSWLSEAHCGQRWDLDYAGLLAAAAGIRRTASGLHRYDWERFSSSQDTRLNMGGFVGRVAFEGDLGPFLPYIKMGEHLHIGQGTAIGLGKYIVEGPDGRPEKAR